MLLIQSPPATSDILSYATHATAQSLTLTPSHCDIPSATYYWHHRSVHGLCVWDLGSYVAQMMEVEHEERPFGKDMDKMDEPKGAV